jgi:hypothetical protein
MIIQHKSIFNLIEIFSKGRKKVATSILPKTHCEQKGIHDFYCDIKKYFIQK